MRVCVPALSFPGLCSTPQGFLTQRERGRQGNATGPWPKRPSSKRKDTYNTVLQNPAFLVPSPRDREKNPSDAPLSCLHVTQLVMGGRHHLIKNHFPTALPLPKQA